MNCHSKLPNPHNKDYGLLTVIHPRWSSVAIPRLLQPNILSQHYKSTYDMLASNSLSCIDLEYDATVAALFQLQGFCSYEVL